MPALRRPDSRRRVAAGLLGSLALHLAVVALIVAHRAAPPEPVVHITVLDDTPAAEPTASVAPAAPGGTPHAPRRARSTPSASGRPDAPAAVPSAPPPREVAVQESHAPAAPSPTLPSSATPTPPSGPQSFRAWRAAHPSPYISDASLAAAGAGGDGSGGHPGRVRRCVPPAGWEARLVYLLVDASGSMATGGASEARACSRQFAGAALEAGAEVAVVSFARTTVVSPPSHDEVEVEAALLAMPDPGGTVLPSREFGMLVDGHRDMPAEIVIVSDGRFAWTGALSDWYARLLHANPANRGRVFTIGGSLHLASLDGLRNLGFDVQPYDGFAPEPARTARQ